MESYLEFTCKLSPETTIEKLMVSDGHTMLFTIIKDGKFWEVGLDKKDIEKLLPYLLHFYYS